MAICMGTTPPEVGGAEVLLDDEEVGLGLLLVSLPPTVSSLSCPYRILNHPHAPILEAQNQHEHESHLFPGCTGTHNPSSE